MSRYGGKNISIFEAFKTTWFHNSINLHKFKTVYVYTFLIFSCNHEEEDNGGIEGDQ